MPSDMVRTCKRCGRLKHGHWCKACYPAPPIPEDKRWHARPVSADAHGYASGPQWLRSERMESWQEEMLIEQRKTNELLVMLIDALAESEGDEDAEPMTYMDGTSVR